MFFSLFSEVVRAMTFLIDAGMVMYWGTARWSPFEIFESYSAVSTFYKVKLFRGSITLKTLCMALPGILEKYLFYMHHLGLNQNLKFCIEIH